MNYTHPKGKGAGKYNGMARANDWVGQAVKATRDVRNGAGTGVRQGTRGKVTGLAKGLAEVTFEGCGTCGSVMYARADYRDIELDDGVRPASSSLPENWQALHLRQYRHNDDSGVVFAYDKEGIDAMLAKLTGK